MTNRYPRLNCGSVKFELWISLINKDMQHSFMDTEKLDFNTVGPYYATFLWATALLE